MGNFRISIVDFPPTNERFDLLRSSLQLFRYRDLNSADLYLIDGGGRARDIMLISRACRVSVVADTEYVVPETAADGLQAAHVELWSRSTRRFQ